VTAQKILLISLATIFIAHDLSALSNLARNDAYPVFSTLDPYNFLYKREKMDMKGLDYGTKNFEFLGLSISPYGQTADSGKDYDGTSTDESHTVPLGDVTGKWAMVPMTFNNGNACDDGFYPCDLSCTLSNARQKLFDKWQSNYTEAYNDQNFNNPSALDPAELCGFFSNDLKYTKRGCRLELAANIRGGFGFTTQASFADINQTLLTRTNTTPATGTDCPTVPAYEDVNKYLMKEITNIAKEAGYDLSDFHESGVEEVRLNLYWRKAIAVNRDRKGYPKCLLMPFFVASGSFSPKTISPHKIYAVPFGNNGHNAYGFSGGLNIDFFESIEFGAEGGLTHFGPRDICNFPIPNSPLQKGLYPFNTTVNYCPGHNWHFATTVAAQRFLENLSVYFQFVIIHHEKDCFQIKDNGQTCCDSGEKMKLENFTPSTLINRSMWTAKVGNLAFNYDVSPNISLGFLWQAPLAQRGTYRSSMVMASFNGTY
jgi:hypothetical protein